MKLILVCGPWSSGTTAVCGVLDALGLDGCGPYFLTNDERTKNSFESQAFRKLVVQLASKSSLRLTVSADAAVAALQEFRQMLELRMGGTEAAADAAPIFLKHPLSAVLIAQLCKVFKTRLVYVLRPIQDIEATRLRRNWSPVHGAAGAHEIYAQMFNILLNSEIPTMIVRYPALLANPRPYSQQLAAFCRLGNVTQERLNLAVNSIRVASGK